MHLLNFRCIYLIKSFSGLRVKINTNFLHFFKLNLFLFNLVQDKLRLALTLFLN
jgi:hypothetical protein